MSQLRFSTTKPPVAYTRSQIHSLRSLPNHWGLRTGTNTECSISLAFNKLLIILPRTAILDLKKAHDRVPRGILQEIIVEALHLQLSTAFIPFLWLISYATEHHKSTPSVTYLPGMIQSDTLSHKFLIYLEITTLKQSTWGHHEN